MRRLWGRLNSINVQKVVWCLDELGLPFDRVDAGGPHGVVHDPAYRALNPNGLVPTLEEDDFVLWESNAIVRHLAASHPQAGLWPTEPRVRADADRWMDWQATTATPAMRDVFWQMIRISPEARDGVIVARSTAASEEMAAILDRTLADRPYMAGDAFTAADIAVGTHVHRWLRMPVERATRPHVESWHARLAARPGSQRVFAVPLT